MHLQGIGTTVPIPVNGLVYRNSRKTIDFNRWIQSEGFVICSILEDFQKSIFLILEFDRINL